MLVGLRTKFLDSGVQAMGCNVQPRCDVSIAVPMMGDLPDGLYFVLFSLA